MANGATPQKKPDNKSRTASYTIDGKSYDFQYTGDKMPSAASIMATFKKHHPQSAARNSETFKKMVGKTPPVLNKLAKKTKKP